jgi:hypothetical protein
MIKILDNSFYLPPENICILQSIIGKSIKKITYDEFLSRNDNKYFVVPIFNPLCLYVESNDSIDQICFKANEKIGEFNEPIVVMNVEVQNDHCVHNYCNVINETIVKIDIYAEVDEIELDQFDIHHILENLKEIIKTASVTGIIRKIYSENFLLFYTSLGKEIAIFTSDEFDASMNFCLDKTLINNMLNGKYFNHKYRLINSVI